MPRIIQPSKGATSVHTSGSGSTTHLLFLLLGLFVFMCLYGYYQELVIYSFFQRKLAMFSTFLHFFGCTIVAYVLKAYNINVLSISLSISRGSPDGKMLNGATSTILPIFNGSISFWHKIRNSITMGDASSKVSIYYHSLLIVLKVLTQGLSNLSMTRINYPAKVLFKSANPVVIMIIGIVWFKKQYPKRDYIVVLLLVIGLYVFITSDYSDSPSGTGSGIFFVTCSMIASASIPTVQEHVMSKYGASVEELLYIQYFGSAVLSLLFSIVTGEFIQGMLYLFTQGSFYTLFSLISFCSFGYLGAIFSTAITHHFGSLVNGICNTARKALTLALSFELFPERNNLTNQHLIGSVIFFSGLLIRVLSKDGKLKKENSELL